MTGDGTGSRGGPSGTSFLGEGIGSCNSWESKYRACKAKLNEEPQFEATDDDVPTGTPRKEGGDERRCSDPTHL